MRSLPTPFLRPFVRLGRPTLGCVFLAATAMPRPASALDILSYDPAQGCPDAASFRRMLTAAGANDGGVDSADEASSPSRSRSELEVTLASGSSGTPAKGRATILDGDGPPRERSVTGTTCDDVARALALAISLATDRSGGDEDGSARPAAESPSNGPEPPGEERRAPDGAGTNLAEPSTAWHGTILPEDNPLDRSAGPDDRARRASARNSRRGRLTVHGAVGGGLVALAPFANRGDPVGGSAYFEATFSRATRGAEGLARPAMWLTPSLRLGAVAAQSATFGEGLTVANHTVVGGHFTVTAARAEGCAEVSVASLPGVAVTVQACARTELGALVAYSTGSDIPYRSPWITAGPVARLRVRLGTFWFLELEGASPVALVRHSIVQSPNLPLEDEPRVGFASGAGLGTTIF